MTSTAYGFMEWCFDIKLAKRESQNSKACGDGATWVILGYFALFAKLSSSEPFVLRIMALAVEMWESHNGMFHVWKVLSLSIIPHAYTHARTFTRVLHQSIFTIKRANWLIRFLTLSWSGHSRLTVDIDTTLPTWYLNVYLTKLCV